MNRHTIGVIGHIDHGKTTLIKQLTGIDTNRHPEEKLRGMTIDIGFAKLNFNNNEFASIVDVPGHEKFIKNMIVGISGVDFIIVVIACDDGIMPQTEEHFQIASLLNKKNGIVVLTKRDIVSIDRQKEVYEECKKYFKDSFLENDIYYSNEDIKNIIYKKLQYCDYKKNELFRLNIDRVFSPTGVGTVVTGTILKGEISAGDKLYIYPQEKEVYIKKIQIHSEEINNVSGFERCALNISNINYKEIKRGDILTIKNSLFKSNRIDCIFELLSTVTKVKNMQRVRINIGTQEVLGRIFIYENNVMLPGEKRVIQIELEEFIYGEIGEVAIIRGYSPITTLGQIRILNYQGLKGNKYNQTYIKNILEYNTDDKTTLLRKVLSENLLSIEKISMFLRVDNINNYLKILEENKTIYKFGSLYCMDKYIEKIVNDISEYIDFFNEREHLSNGVDLLFIKDKFFRQLANKEFTLFLENDIFKSRFRIQKNKINFINYKIKLTKEEKKIKEYIYSIYKNIKFNLVSYNEMDRDNIEEKLFAKIHKYMQEMDFIIHLKDNYFILNGYLKESIKLITNYLEKHKKISLLEAREILNCDRNSCIMILEKLDSMKITVFNNNIRILGGKNVKS